MTAMIDAFVAAPLVRAIGWALMHFTWQAALIASLAAIICNLVGRAQVRYAICVAALTLIAIAPLITLSVIDQPAAISAGSSEAPFLAGPSSSSQVQFENILPVLAALWLSGVLVFQIRLAVQWLRVQRWRRVGISVLAEPFAGIAQSALDRVSLRRPVRIVESAVALTPMVIGWVRPVILLPSASLTGLTPDQLFAVLVHELSHIKRHDYLVNLIQAVVEAIYFFHPAVWWLSARIRLEREYCCDDAAVAVSLNPIRYARALSSLDALRVPTTEPAVGSTGGSLMNRIKRIVGMPTPNPRRAWVIPALVLGAMTAAVPALGLAAPERDDDAPVIVERMLMQDGEVFEYRLAAPVHLEEIEMHTDSFLEFQIVERSALDLFHADLVEGLKAAGADCEVIEHVLQSLGVADQATDLAGEWSSLTIDLAVYDVQERTALESPHVTFSRARIADHDAIDDHGIWRRNAEWPAGHVHPGDELIEGHARLGTDCSACHVGTVPAVSPHPVEPEVFEYINPDDHQLDPAILDLLPEATSEPRVERGLLEQIHVDLYDHALAARRHVHSTLIDHVVTLYRVERSLSVKDEFPVTNDGGTDRSK